MRGPSQADRTAHGKTKRRDRWGAYLFRELQVVKYVGDEAECKTTMEKVCQSLRKLNILHPPTLNCRARTRA